MSKKSWPILYSKFYVQWAKTYSRIKMNFLIIFLFIKFFHKYFFIRIFIAMRLIDLWFMAWLVHPPRGSPTMYKGQDDTPLSFIHLHGCFKMVLSEFHLFNMGVFVHKKIRACLYMSPWHFKYEDTKFIRSYSLVFLR